MMDALEQPVEANFGARRRHVIDLPNLDIWPIYHGVSSEIAMVLESNFESKLYNNDCYRVY